MSDRHVGKRCTRAAAIVCAAGLGVGVSGALAAPAGPDDPAYAAQDVTAFDLEDLMKLKVTSAARKEQALSDVASAIYVIRADDLRRMGATTLADALRAVPGMLVARAEANAWAITARGFSGIL